MEENATVFLRPVFPNNAQGTAFRPLCLASGCPKSGPDLKLPAEFPTAPFQDPSLGWPASIGSTHRPGFLGHSFLRMPLLPNALLSPLCLLVAAEPQVSRSSVCPLFPFSLHTHPPFPSHCLPGGSPEHLPPLPALLYLSQQLPWASLALPCPLSTSPPQDIFTF